VSVRVGGDVRNKDRRAGEHLGRLPQAQPVQVPRVDRLNIVCQRCGSTGLGETTSAAGPSGVAHAQLSPPSRVDISVPRARPGRRLRKHHPCAECLRPVVSTAGLVAATFALAYEHADAAARVAATPMKLVERSALAVYTDGERFAVIERGGGASLRILDSSTGAQREVAVPGCSVSTFARSQTNLSKGASLLNCRDAPYLLNLRSGNRRELPVRFHSAGVEVRLRYVALGAAWALTDAVPCDLRGRRFCQVAINRRSGLLRLVPLFSGTRFADLDDPGLRERTVCPPHQGVVHFESQRQYEPPYVLQAPFVRRCGERGRLFTFPGDIYPETANLSVGLASAGNATSTGDGRVYLYRPQTDRLAVWRVPRVRPDRFRSGGVAHTRRHVYLAASLQYTVEGDPKAVRVFRAAVPRALIHQPARSAAP